MWLCLAQADETWHDEMMPLRFSAKADRHKVPRRSTWRVVMTARPESITTNWGESGLLHIGYDDRGIELEVITIQRRHDEIVVHSMPTSHRHTEGD